MLHETDEIRTLPGWITGQILGVDGGLADLRSKATS
jgi:hypothetical protein